MEIIALLKDVIQNKKGIETPPTTDVVERVEEIHLNKVFIVESGKQLLKG